MAHRKSTIKLAFGHNLIATPPKKVSLKEVSSKMLENATRKGISKLGLFDINSPNFNTYYPDVSAGDLKPKASDFVYPVFRALSKVVVHKEVNPVDFSSNNVLKRSTNLLVGQTVYPDHEAAVGNSLGSVAEAYWQGATVSKGGILIPAGIDVKMKIDGKANPRLARGLMMDPPSVHSTSVTVNFNWEPSHPTLSEEEFFTKLGTTDKTGVLIRRIANRINHYDEISFVSHGADPFAQKKGKDGEIVNPEYAAIVNNSATPKEKKSQKFFFFDFKSNTIQNSTKRTIPKKTIIKNTSTDMKKLFTLLAAHLSLASFDPNNQEHVLKISKSLKTLSKNSQELEQLKKDLGISKKSLAKLKSQLEATDKKYTTLLAFKKSQLSKLRKLVLRNYRLSTDDPKPAILELIKKTRDVSYLEALKQQYSQAVSEKFHDRCSECGSENITRASSAVEKQLSKASKTVLSAEELRDAVMDNSYNNSVHFMHGEEKEGEE